MSKLTFHQGVGRGDQVVTLDGEDISKQVRSVSITADAGQPPGVVLELLVHEVDSEIEQGVSEIRVPQATADLLSRFGWIAPPSGYVVRKSYTAEGI